MPEEVQQLSIPKKNTDFIQVSMVLPSPDKFTEQKIETAVNEVYKGYSKANPDAMKTLDQVVQYVQGREREHSKSMAAGLTTAIKIRAAVNACRWDLGQVIETAMQNPDYGTNVVPTLATALGLDEADVVGLSLMHKNLTRVEAYVMGLYGVPTPRLIQIASIPDDNTRKKLVEVCTGSPLDLADSRAVSKHTSRVLNAIKAALLPATPAIETAEDGTEEAEEQQQEEAVFERVPDAVHRAISALETLESSLKPFREARLEKDEETLVAVDPSSLDMGTEVVKQMTDILLEKAKLLDKDLNNVEDILRAYRDSIHSLLSAFGERQDADTVEEDGGSGQA